MIRCERVEEIKGDCQVSGFIYEKKMEEIRLDIGDEIWIHFEFKMPVGHTGSSNQLRMNMKIERVVRDGE